MGFSTPDAVEGDDHAVAEFRRLKAKYSASEWRALGSEGKSRVMATARERCRALDARPETPSTMSVFELMCARAKALADLRAIEDALRAHAAAASKEDQEDPPAEENFVDDVASIEKAWRVLRFDRSGSPPPSCIPRFVRSEDSSSEDDGEDGAELSRKAYSPRRCVFRRLVVRLGEEEERNGEKRDEDAAPRRSSRGKRSSSRRNNPIEGSELLEERRRSLRIFLASSAAPEEGEETEEAAPPAAAAAGKEETSAAGASAILAVEKPVAPARRSSRVKRRKVVDADATTASVPAVGTVVWALFDDGYQYRGVVVEDLGNNKARIEYDDGDVDDVNFPDPDIEVVGEEPTKRKKPPKRRRSSTASRAAAEEDGEVDESKPGTDAVTVGGGGGGVGEVTSAPSEEEPAKRRKTRGKRGATTRAEDRAPPVRTVTHTLVANGKKNKGEVVADLGNNQARIRCDNGNEEEETAFPDPDVHEEGQEPVATGPAPARARRKRRERSQTTRSSSPRKAQALEHQEVTPAESPAIAAPAPSMTTDSNDEEDRSEAFDGLPESESSRRPRRDRSSRSCAQQLEDAKLAAQLQEEEYRMARRQRTTRAQQPPAPAPAKKIPKLQEPPQHPQQQQPRPAPPTTTEEPAGAPPPSHVLFAFPSQGAEVAPDDINTQQQPPASQAPPAQKEEVEGEGEGEEEEEEEEGEQQGTSVGKEEDTVPRRLTSAAEQPDQRRDEATTVAITQPSELRVAVGNIGVPVSEPVKANDNKWPLSSKSPPKSSVAASMEGNDDEDNATRCPVCLSDDGMVVALWCCGKRACDSCLGRLGDFGFRCFFCRASIPPRRVRAMLSDEPEWPPARPAAGNLVKRAFQAGPAQSRLGPSRARPKRTPRRVESEVGVAVSERPTSPLPRRNIRSSQDFVGEVVCLESSLWYSARDGETPGYVANALRCSATRVVAMTNAATLPRRLQRPCSPLVSEHEALTEGRVVRLPPCVADAASHSSGDAIWVVPPRTATELIDGEAYYDDTDQRVWYSACEDDTPERIAGRFGADVALVAANTAKLVHLASRRTSAGTRIRARDPLGRRTRLKARTVVLLPGGTEIPQQLTRRKPCAYCRICGNRGAFTCRSVLGHTASDFDQPKPVPGARVRVRWRINDDDDDNGRGEAPRQPVWGWYYGAVSSVKDDRFVIIYDGEEEDEDEQVWPNEDVVMLPADTTGTRLVRQQPDDRLVAYLVGKRLHQADSLFYVSNAYVSLVEGFDGAAVILATDDHTRARDATEPNDSDHHLLADLATEGFEWDDPASARAAAAVLEGRCLSNDSDLERILPAPKKSDDGQPQAANFATVSEDDAMTPVDESPVDEAPVDEIFAASSSFGVSAMPPAAASCAAVASRTRPALGSSRSFAVTMRQEEARMPRGAILATAKLPAKPRFTAVVPKTESKRFAATPSSNRAGVAMLPVGSDLSSLSSQANAAVQTADANLAVAIIPGDNNTLPVDVDRSAAKEHEAQGDEAPMSPPQDANGTAVLSQENATLPSATR